LIQHSILFDQNVLLQGVPIKKIKFMIIENNVGRISYCLKKCYKWIRYILKRYENKMIKLMSDVENNHSVLIILHL